LRTQAQAAAAALAALESSQQAQQALDAARAEHAAVSAELAGTPARRVLRRRELDTAGTQALTRVHAAAEATDTRAHAEDEQIRIRLAQRSDRTRAQLTTAENERARRRALSPTEAAAEAYARQQLREETLHLGDKTPSPSLIPAPALVATRGAEQITHQRGRDRGQEQEL